jgi:hypothetical protein
LLKQKAGHPEKNKRQLASMQVSKLLVVALVCVVLISGAETSAGAAVAVPRALLRTSSVLLPAALPHAAAAAAAGVGTVDGCCRPGPNCCASDDSP